MGRCEECRCNLVNGNIWGFQVQKKMNSEFHYYCSEEHANLGMEKLKKGAIEVGIIVDKGKTG